MKAVARHRYLRIAPRKVRMVADLVRGKNVREARTILQFAVKGATEPVLKALEAAIAAAKQKDSKEEDLYISKITVDQGPTLKRWRARARGRAFPIHKKTSHIILELDEGSVKTVKVAEQKVTGPAVQTEKPAKAIREVPAAATETAKKTEAVIGEKAAAPKFVPQKKEEKAKRGNIIARRLFRRKAI